MHSRLANRRIRLLLAFLALAFAIAFARAFWLQVVRAPRLERLAAQQHHETITTPAGRGTIYDRMGAPLAIGEEATTVYADPKQVRNAQRVAVEAGHALDLDPNKIYPQLLDRKQSFVYVERKADPERAAALERRGLAGLDFYPEERRSYPQHSVASQVLGYAGIDNTGIAGLELGLERYLAGKPGKETIVRDPFGRTIDVVSSTPEQPGRDVFLTLDHTLQAKVESVLRETVAKWHATDGTAIVLDPRTGGVLAMASAPGFDANDYPKVPSSLQRNRAVTDTYEPGSTFKVVTYAAALTDHVVTPNTTFTLAAVDRRRRPDDRRGRAAADRDDVRGRDARPVVERRHDHARRAARPEATRCMDRPIRLREDHRHRLPGRERGDRPAGGQVVRLDDRERPDRSGHRRHADPDGIRVRRAREPRRVARAPPRRPRAGTQAGEGPPPARRLADDRPRADGDAPGRRLFGGHRRRGGGARATWSRGRREPRPSPIRTAATRTRTTSPRSSGSSRPARPVRSSSSRSTSRRVRSSAASSPPRHSATSPASRSSTWMSRRTTRRR